jgi:MEDS: MEthanogen/methylotroph, DcmR Sensory domain
MAEVDKTIRCAGATLSEHRHICAFFRGLEEEYRVLLPFIKEGFDQGDKAFHVVNPQLNDEHRRHLDSAGIDVRSAEKSGQLELRNWDDMYFRDGRFDQHEMLTLWQMVFDEAHQQGFPLTRVIAHLEWVLEDRQGVNDLLEYEARFNLVSARHRDPVICAYDLTKFGAGLVMDVLRTHPLVILGGSLQVNPFFVPPAEFLRELREREARAGHV